MKICLDIGNTNTKLANFVNNSIENLVVFSEIYKALEYIVINKAQISKIFISSVVPANTAKFKALSDRNEIPFCEINYKSPFSFLIIYNTPETLGIDRLCGMEGAIAFVEEKKKSFENKPIVTIDFGTATTINILSPQNEFIGGAIAPGVVTMIKSLNENTSQLPDISSSSFTEEIGTDTISSISSGVINSQIGLISQLVYKTTMKYNTDPIVLTTGGNFHLIKEYIKIEHNHEENLVLKGINSLKDKIK